ncbi:DUF4864 domain-containing protein [Caenimonas sedimenti]|uniref:DUF4864 domain-containing protein n=1 Tax=Caenimonas sedimenti TaxID=2596921 RepID=A0A562ZLN9_9BURK|nr:DUF4864 domain-containing protein [Caenimonas sedimenti]TWO69403.1 DUF4864 domain-containing protein [Caenimonas sedimenti]
MSPMILRFFTLVGIALAAASMQLKARAETVPDAEVQQVRAVILQQLKAFSEDDAEAAFAAATPEVRKAIGNPDRFLAMVRGNYPMVYRAAGFGFLAPEKEQGTVLQIVTIRDGNDKTWLALFSMVQQPDMSWRIGGCIVAENDWRTT